MRRPDEGILQGQALKQLFFICLRRAGTYAEYPVETAPVHQGSCQQNDTDSKKNDPCCALNLFRGIEYGNHCEDDDADNGIDAADILFHSYGF
jgi:hypothetical protein